MYTGRSFKRDQMSTIKCRITDGGLYNYSGYSICHETVSIIIEEEFRDQESFELEKEVWYSINTVIEDYSNGHIKIKVDEESEIERIGSKVNDWRGQISLGGGIPRHSNQSGGKDTRSLNSGTVSQFRSMSGSTESMQSADSVVAGSTGQNVEGFATGGAKNIDNFRDNIDEGYIPETDSMTYEGLFYDYEFNISGSSKDSIFYPVYEHANIVDPISNNERHFLALGLESGIESMRRPPLDLMLVLDVSGSMGSSIENYHYDRNNPKKSSQSKMEATIDVVDKVVNQLRDEDRLGVVLYNNQSYISKPIRRMDSTDSEGLKQGIEELKAGGGTNLSSGFESAVTEMREHAEIDTNDTDRESRIMFFTDAMPNTGITDTDQLTDRMSNVADEHDIHTTFIGIGIDANPEFINSISGIKGSNHYFANSTDEFKEKVGEEFTLMTVPLVYNLELTLEGTDYSIEQVYGNPSEGTDDSRVMHTETLFPSTGEDGAKGGVILVELDDVKENSELRISATWENRDGERSSDVRTVDISSANPDYYESSDVRKAVVLQRYVRSLRNWLDEYKRFDLEHKSVDVEVSGDQREEFEEILEFMNSNRDEIDDDIGREIRTIEEILA